MESVDEPHAKRSGWLKNGNPCGDPFKAPRCGAKIRQGRSCKAPAMKNGRCRMHGGCSTGPKTKEGLERSKHARWIHGRYSENARRKRKLLNEMIRVYLKTIESVQQRSNFYIQS